jgi:hypothetical protein
MAETLEKRVQEDKELERLSEVVLGLVRFLPAERLSAGEALKHIQPQTSKGQKGGKKK